MMAIDLRHGSRPSTILRSGLGAAVAAAVFCGPVAAQETYKVGIVSFLSGQAAESFGIPAVNGAKVLIEAFNAGSAPAPYNKVGFGGLKIEPVYVDENGGATQQVQELRNLYDREKVDAVVGYVGSGDCLAVAPVAEEMKKFLILYDCGTPRIFEDGKYAYVFRTAAHATMDNVALALYLKQRNVKADTFNMINQDYAWGQDSKKDFVLAMAKLYPNAKPAEDLLPKFGAGQYGT
jgi:branched-chain amino acid transport system substrate-binding protein